MTLPHKRFDQVTWLASHNSFASRNAGWLYAQQKLTLDEQFAHGVRCFLVDFHWYDSSKGCCGALGCMPKRTRYMALMHGDNVDLNRLQYPHRPQKVAWLLDRVKRWLKRDTKAIITLIVEDYVGDEGHAMLLHLLRKRNMTQYCFVKHDTHTPFPTLRAMCEANTRLVIFTSHNSDAIGTSPIVMPSSTMLKTNHWDMCKYPQGDMMYNTRGKLALFNHFEPVSLDVPIVHDYTNINAYSRIQPRVAQFTATAKQKPNFVALDYVQEGQGKRVVDTLNAL